MPNKGDINPQTGKAYAVNPQTGVWDDNYFANVVEPQFRGGGGQQSSGGSSYSGGGGGGDVLGLAQQIAGFGQQNIAPVVSSLKERYKVLLDKIGQTSSNELGARGIPISSTSAQEKINKDQLDAMTTQNAQLAGIQAQPGQDAIGQAMNLYQMQQQGNQWQQNFDYQKQQNQLAQSGSSGGINALGGFNGMSTPPTSQPPSGNPGGQTSSNFKPISQTTQNSSFNPSAFSGQNIQYAGNKIASAIKPVVNTVNALSNPIQTAQNMYKSFTSNPISSAKNIYSSASNLFKGLFG